DGPPSYLPAGRAGVRPGREPGPRGLGPDVGRRTSWGGLPSKLHVEGLLAVSAPDLERDCVAGLLPRDHVAELVEGVEPDAVRGDDQVSTERIRLAGDGHLLPSSTEARLRGGAAGVDARDEQAVRS